MNKWNSVSIPQEFRAMRTTLTISNREIKSDHGGATWSRWWQEQTSLFGSLFGTEDYGQIRPNIGTSSWGWVDIPKLTWLSNESSSHLENLSAMRSAFAENVIVMPWVRPVTDIESFPYCSHNHDSSKDSSSGNASWLQVLTSVVA